MARKGQGSNWHPARVSGQAKRERERTANRLLEEKHNKRHFQKVDMSKPDWSLQR